jgi:hypothetical protein
MNLAFALACQLNKIFNALEVQFGQLVAIRYCQTFDARTFDNLNISNTLGQVYQNAEDTARGTGFTEMME